MWGETISESTKWLRVRVRWQRAKGLVAKGDKLRVLKEQQGIAVSMACCCCGG